jgi:hypothetical protein
MRTTDFVTLAISAGAAMLLASTPTAVAALQTYDFVFTSGGMDATGTITVDNGAAVSGSINVTGVPLEASPTTLISAAGLLLPASGATDARNHDGDVITYDNVVNPGSNPILSGNGLGFGSGQYGANNYNLLINLWGNSPDSYTLFIGEAQLDGNGNVIGDPQWVYALNNGSLTLTVAVPEPTTWTSPMVLVALAVCSAGPVAFRRRRAVA